MKILFSVYCIFIITVSHAQSNKLGRFKDSIFNVTVRKNLFYNNNNEVKTNYRQYDLYEPINDSSLKRPLIIWMHGGGFKYGSKNAKEIKLWGRQFAQRGYLVAAINYRLSKKHPIGKFRDLVSACYDGVDDLQLAINNFKSNASQLHIDTNKIIVGGNSAGAMIALQAVFSNRADVQNVIDSNKTIANSGKYNTMNIAAVINFWGALLDKDWLIRANVPIVSVCGAKDKLIPVDTKGVAFFGSVAIHKKADALHIPNEIKVYEGYGHELQKHFNPLFRSKATKRRWKEAADFSAQFLYDKVVR